MCSYGGERKREDESHLIWELLANTHGVPFLLRENGKEGREGEEREGTENWRTKEADLLFFQGGDMGHVPRRGPEHDHLQPSAV